MNTEVLKGIDGIKKGAEIIKDGGLVVFPTETVYGLGADAMNESAVSEIFKVKGRPQDNPLIVHISDIEQINMIAVDISEQARKVVEAYMPGPITVILKKGDCVPSVVTAGGKTVGVRLPNNELARAFIRECGTPIAAPSANTSTKISPTKAEHVYEDLKGKIPLIIDGGDCEVGIESTIIDLSVDTPTILRPGAITASMLASTLGRVDTFKGEVIVAKAPGMKYKHYAPSCEMVISDKPEKAITKYKEKSALGAKPIILCAGKNKDLYRGMSYMSLGDTDDEIMRNVYGLLHECEKHCDYLICEDLGNDGKCGSVMNRLMKSAGGNVL